MTSRRRFHVAKELLRLRYIRGRGGAELKHLTRFEINGVRHYRTGDKPDCAYPSVTAILSKTASEKTKKVLHDWNLRNPGAKEKAAERGTIIHKACEDHIRGRGVDVPPEYRCYWEGLARRLDAYDHFVWSEKPLQPGWSFCTGEDGISRIWSHNHHYCGCPDIVGVRKGIMTLADVKSSTGRYSRYHPEQIKLDESSDSRAWDFYGGWKKFTKCALQLGAYAIALEETLDISVDQAQMIITTDQHTQSFLLKHYELSSWRYKWLQRCKLYYEIVAREQAVAKALQDVASGLPGALPSMGSKHLIAA